MPQEPGTTIENAAVNFKAPRLDKENVQAMIIYNTSGEKGKPGIVQTDPETGRVIAVGETDKEISDRLKKLNETPKSIQDPVTGADTVNPAWLQARAEALGLTTEEYQKLVDEGVKDVGEYVGKTGRTEEEIQSFADMMAEKKLKGDKVEEKPVIPEATEQEKADFERVNSINKKDQAKEFIERVLIGENREEYDAKMKGVDIMDLSKKHNEFINEKKVNLSDLEKRAIEGNVSVEEADRIRDAYRAKKNLMGSIGGGETYGLTIEEVKSWDIEKTEAWIKQKGEELQGEDKIKFQEIISNHSGDPTPIVYKDVEDYKKMTGSHEGMMGSIKEIHTLPDGSHFIEIEMRGPYINEPSPTNFPNYYDDVNPFTKPDRIGDWWGNDHQQ